MIKTTNKRKPISKKIRFEVFKRDKFTCQYCGKSAPNVVLEVDHIDPVADGGGNDIMNLVTSCFDCNRGKGKRKLDDGTVVKKQMEQLQELAKRREQLDMMLRWREELTDLKSSEIDVVCNAFKESTGYSVNETGRRSVKKWLKEFSLSEILDAMDTSIDNYFYGTNGEETADGALKAFRKTSGICKLKRLQEAKGYDNRFYYVNYIAKAFRNRGWNCDKETIKVMVFDIVESEYDFETLKEYLNVSRKQRDFWAEISENYGKRYYV